MSELVGKRVVLVPFGETDISPAYIGWLNNPEVVRFSNQRFKRHDRQSSEVYVRRFNGTANQFWSIRLIEGGEMIGTMTAYLALPHGTADLGMMIGERLRWGQGYGLEAWSLLMEFLLGEMGLRKVTAGAVACNSGMITIMQRSGMHQEATRHDQEIIEGKPHDIVYFAKFRDA